MKRLIAFVMLGAALALAGNAVAQAVRLGKGFTLGPI